MNALIISVVWKIFVMIHGFSGVRIFTMHLNCKQKKILYNLKGFFTNGFQV